MKSTLSFVALALASLTSPTWSQKTPEGPPGLVYIEGGKTLMGSKVKDIEALFPTHEEVRHQLAGETPQHVVKVSPFFLMPTEVTNEQYAEYLRIRGGKPPVAWADLKAMNEARSAFLEKQGKENEERIKEGKRPIREKFDTETWWETNWEEHSWAVPAKLLLNPVVRVTYKDAAGYARWAGLRLMTEAEFTCAARGDSDKLYPWGDQWNDKKFASTIHYGEKDETSQVGSFPAGAAQDIFDLSGNAWEWTSSPYVKFEGYKPITVKVSGKNERRIEGLAGFNPSYKVIVGGSFANDKIAARITTRGGFIPSQSTDALGFRCAASIRPGLDAAQWIVSEDIRLSKLTTLEDEDLDFYPQGAVARKRWQTLSQTAMSARGAEEGMADPEAGETKQPDPAPVPGYAVIESYDQVVFVPTLQAPGNSVKTLATRSVKLPVILGVLSTTVPVMEPDLTPGTYVLGWRAAGKLPKAEKKEEEKEGTQGIALEGAQDEVLEGMESFASTPGFSADDDCYMLFDTQGNPLVAWKAGKLAFERLSKESTITVEPFVPPSEEPEEGAEPIVPMDTLKIFAGVPSKLKAQGFYVDLRLKIAPGTVDESWK